MLTIEKPRIRAYIWGGVALLAILSYLLSPVIGMRGRAFVGAICLLGIAVSFSQDVARINWRTVWWGLFFQVLLALLVVKLTIGGVQPGKEFFLIASQGIERFLQFTDAGTRFVFGDLADPAALGSAFRKERSFVFALAVLPVIVFVSAVFSLLHHVGLIQILVAAAAKFMKRFMRTSGAETLAAVENVFMGQSEAPLIVRPYIAKMTNSEILALMTGGMATLSGGMIAVYIAMGVDSVALLAGSVMAAPASLYLAKIFVPETSTPETSGDTQPVFENEHANALEAIASGADRGMKLAISIAAMLIAFLALIACVDFILTSISPVGSLQRIFSWIFSPLAFLIGAADHDILPVANLLGTKAVTNEFVAYAQMTDKAMQLDARSITLATYALGGFANLGSIGIQIGALSVIAPSRRADFARLGGPAFAAGFLATLINAAIVGALL